MNLLEFNILSYRLQKLKNMKKWLESQFFFQYLAPTYLSFLCHMPLFQKIKKELYAWKSIYYAVYLTYDFCRRPNFKPPFLRNAFLQKLSGSWKIWNNSARKYPFAIILVSFICWRIELLKNVEFSIICDFWPKCILLITFVPQIHTRDTRPCAILILACGLI